ncbi:MAG: TetR/AcrR family transcriptional regulator [Nocardioides alkalitolerans]
MTSEANGPTRSDRRRARTRAALVAAAQELLAEGRQAAPIQEVTERADVGIGTFYNHFATRDELFDAALEDGLARWGDLLDALGDLADPAEQFARSWRLTGRMHRLEPQLSKVLLTRGHELSRSADGIGPRARRDLQAAQDAGRLDRRDLDRTMVLVTGAMIELGWLLHDDPDRDAAQMTDAVAADVLVALGMGRTEAERLSGLPLPDGLELP